VTKTGTKDVASPSVRALAPLYAAGFVTAFGAHSVAAGLGAETDNIGIGLLTFGILLAVYDAAEVVLKPIFGSLSDRIGMKPVIIGGLLVFALASLLGIASADPVMLGIARLGQGAGASAFSPASSAAVARLAGPSAAGRYFGNYGSWKGLGYAFGPLLGAGLMLAGGFATLFIVLAILAAVIAVWVLIELPKIAVLPRPRYTIVDLFRQTTHRSFLVPTLALAAATGTLGVAVGFLPLTGAQLHLPLIVSMAAVTVLAVTSTVIQPLAGRLRDAGRITPRAGITAGLVAIVVGLAILALTPTPVTLYLSAMALGFGIGVTTPLAFAHLAATTPHERMGRTMGNAEIGREVGDAGGPLLVGGIANVTTLTAGLGALALLATAIAAIAFSALRRTTQAESAPPTGS